LNGCGCLFPRDQGFRARGVLMNDAIFAGRSDYRSETWILGGALDRVIVNRSDDEIAAIVATDHERFTGRQETPLGLTITRWPNALPHYDLTLEKALAELPSHLDQAAPLVLSGNYLGGIGLAKVLDRSAAAVQEMLARL
jgi:oxygen-dependent protoporphyrinogen oxidase